MAVVNEKSTELDGADADPQTSIHAVDYSGKLRVAHFDYTRTTVGDAGSEVELVRLPKGRKRIFGNLSKIEFSAMGASRTMDVGHKAYTGNDGVAVAEDDDEFCSDVDTSSAGSTTLDEVSAAGATDTFLIQSRDDVSIFATVDGATFPAAATLTGYIVYAME